MTGTPLVSVEPRPPVAPRLDTRPTLLLRGPTLLEAAWLVGLGLQELRRRQGVAPWSRLLELHQVLDVAAADERRMSGTGQPDVRAEADSATWPSTRWIGTAEVAQILGISQRQAQRLGPKIGVRHGQAYRFDAAAVTIYAADQGDAA